MLVNSKLRIHNYDKGCLTVEVKHPLLCYLIFKNWLFLMPEKLFFRKAKPENRSILMRM